MFSKRGWIPFFTNFPASTAMESAMVNQWNRSTHRVTAPISYPMYKYSDIYLALSHCLK